MDNSPQKKKPRKDDDDTTGDQKIIMQCDRCKSPLSDVDYIRNNPCGHIICFLCSVKSNMNRITNPAYCQVSDCHQKYTISCQYFHRGIPGEIVKNDTIVELGSDEVAWILGFLPLQKIMCLRLVSMTWKEAAKKTIVPTSDNRSIYFPINCVARYNAINVMTRALPNLQQINLYGLGIGHKFNDGEDPNEEYAALIADFVTHDIEIISNFSKLRILAISNALLNGRYPFLFNFPLLQKLSISRCHYLKWDLEMLAGLPLLKELECTDNWDLTGNINSLRVLKDTLEKVHTESCYNVEGNLMDLADFPRLNELDLDDTAVTGDIRDIGENDFSSLEDLVLPEKVYGAQGSEFQRISDGSDLVRAVYLLKKKIPAIDIKYWYGRLSVDSPDWYDSAEDVDDTPPFYIVLVEAGSRLGYRWETNSDNKNPCEVNWLDPEPDRESSEYEEYIAESQKLDRNVDMYRGFHQPPTEEEYDRLFGIIE